MRQKSWREGGSGPERALGRAIRRVRTDSEMSRKELAERTGISYPYLTEIEGGKKMPSQRVVATIADALGVRPHHFLRIAEEMTLQPPVEHQYEPVAMMSPPGDLEDDQVFIEDPIEPPSKRYFHALDLADAPVALAAAPKASMSLPPPTDLDPRGELQMLLYRIAADLDTDDLARLVELARRLGDR